MNIGSTDLTADVDFNALKKRTENKLVSFGPVTQRQFLLQMQIEARLQVCLVYEQRNYFFKIRTRTKFSFLFEDVTREMYRPKAKRTAAARF